MTKLKTAIITEFDFAKARYDGKLVMYGLVTGGIAAAQGRRVITVLDTEQVASILGAVPAVTFKDDPEAWAAYKTLRSFLKGENV